MNSPPSLNEIDRMSKDAVVSAHSALFELETLKRTVASLKATVASLEKSVNSERYLVAELAKQHREMRERIAELETLVL